MKVSAGAASRSSPSSQVLKPNFQARVLVERPVEPAAVAFVRAVLLVNKANVMDPKMPDDVVALCKFVIARHCSTASLFEIKILQQ